MASSQADSARRCAGFRAIGAGCCVVASMKNILFSVWFTTAAISLVACHGGTPSSDSDVAPAPPQAPPSPPSAIPGVVDSVGSEVALDAARGGAYPRITRLSDDTLLAVFTTFTGNIHHIPLARSTNDGASWSAAGEV